MDVQENLVTEVVEGVNPFEIATKKHPPGGLRTFPVLPAGVNKFYLEEIIYVQNVKRTWEGKTSYQDQLRFRFVSVGSFPCKDKEGKDSVDRATVTKFISIPSDITNEKANLRKFLLITCGEAFTKCGKDTAAVWALIQGLKGNLYLLQTQPSKDNRFNDLVSIMPATDDDGRQLKVKPEQARPVPVRKPDAGTPVQAEDDSADEIPF